MSDVVKSIYFKQSEIIDGISRLYCPDGFDCDATYGNGVFWKGRDRAEFCYDIDPQFDYVTEACSMNLPNENGSLGSMVFDPPFLTYIKQGRSHANGGAIMSKRFGGYYRYDELEDHYIHTISEAYRVLRHKGILVFKCQDIIHNHRMHCTHNNVINWCETEGFRLKDLFILAATHRMPSPQRGQQRHARVFHSYFLVLQKWGR